MGVVDGQAISAAITNAAFLNKNQADQMTNPVSFTKTFSLAKRDESSAATLNALDSSSALVNVTGTVTTINGATAPATYSDGARLIIVNSSSNTVSVIHESASATATNRFSFAAPGSASIFPQQSVEFVYNSTLSRWQRLNAGTITVSSSYWLSANQAVTADVTVINFNSSEFDYTNAVTTGAAWSFVAPVGGLYSIQGKVSASAACNVFVWVNGSKYKSVGSQPTGAASAFSGVIQLNANDDIHFRSANTVTINGGTLASGATTVSITRIGG